MKYLKYLPSILTGLYLAGAFSCSSNVLKNYDSNEIYKDYLIAQTARHGEVLTKLRFDSLLKTLDKNEIERIKFKLSDEAVKEIIKGN